MQLAPEVRYRALRTVNLGRMMVQHQGEEKLDRNAKPIETECEKVDLTDRQLDVLRLLVKGYSNKRIAAILTISKATVCFHLKGTYSRSGIESRTGLVAWAIRGRVVEDE
jgi:DNA-binding NarL/FixJ family response regulator